MHKVNVMNAKVQQVLQRGVAIPAHPLALNAQRKLDERRQRALSRYYIAAGAGGLAIGVHTTQFEIRDSKVGLFRAVLEIGAQEMDNVAATRVSPCSETAEGETSLAPTKPLVRIAGICGSTSQATKEASLI